MPTAKAKASSNGHAPTEVAAPVVATPTIQISRLAEETMLVPIIGVTPLMVHQFSEKAKRQMLDNMQGRKTPKEPKNPEAEYEAAFYRRADGAPGFPSNAFKLATVGAARFYGKQVKMTELRQFMFIFGEGHDQLCAIEGEPEMREDVVRVGQGTDLRYRPEFAQWSTVLEVTYISSVITRDSVLSLIDAGGLGVGIGEWRPEKGGTHGTYRIDPNSEVVVTS